MIRVKNTLFVLPILMIGMCSFSSSTDGRNTFKIEIAEDDQSTTLVCHHGCAWTKLSFTKPAEKTKVMVDEFGMVNDSNETEIIDHSLADFKFSITKKGEKYLLESKKGTNWKELSFTIKPYAAPVGLDINGMTSFSR